MYTVYVDGTCIYDDTLLTDEYAIINPVLTLEDNSAGSFEFTLPPTNSGYGIVKRLTSEIIIKRKEKFENTEVEVEIWSGRPVQDTYDIFKNQKITCEGELAYLNDTIQPPAEYHVSGGQTTAVRSFLNSLIAIHNSKIPEGSNKRFEVGAVTVTDPNDYIYRYTNYENTLEAIKEKLLDRLGGHLMIRKLNGVRYLDYIRDVDLPQNTQVIRFGENLLDYTESFDMSDICTVCVPRGERLEESEIEALDSYLTVASVNQGSIYVVNQTAVNRYGWIVHVVDFNDITDPTNLLIKGQEYLSSMQFEALKLELTALDLHLLDINVEAIDILDQIRCISEPHGLDKYYPVTKIQIPLQNPESATYFLGDTTFKSLSSVSRANNEYLKYQIEEARALRPPTQEILDEALSNANNLLNRYMNGYISWIQTEYVTEQGVEHRNELYISDRENLTDSTKLWRWNLGGLAYGTKESGVDVTEMSGSDWTTAITMDGTIAGQLISGLTVTGNQIIGGIIEGYGADPTSHTGNYWNLNTGELHVEGISNAEVDTQFQYCLYESDLIAPEEDDPGWQNTFPIRSTGYYIWQRIKTTYANGDISYTTAMCISNGMDGLVPYIVSDRGADVSDLQEVVVTLTAIIANGSGEDVDPYGNDYIYLWFIRVDNSSSISFLDVGKRIVIRINDVLCDEFAGIWFETDVPEVLPYKNDAGNNYENEDGIIYNIYDLDIHGATGAT